MIKRMERRGRRLSTQILVFQVLILAGTMLIGASLAVYAARQRLDREYERRALGIAQTVAATPEIARAIAARDRSGVVQRRAEAIRRATGVSAVVVTDDRGIRYSHTNPARIGERVSTDPSVALAGGTELAVQTGTLGRSARAKVPLRDAAGTDHRHRVGPGLAEAVPQGPRDRVADHRALRGRRAAARAAGVATCSPAGSSARRSGSSSTTWPSCCASARPRCGASARA